MVNDAVSRMAIAVSDQTATCFLARLIAVWTADKHTLVQVLPPVRWHRSTADACGKDLSISPLSIIAVANKLMLPCGAHNY